MGKKGEFQNINLQFKMNKKEQIRNLKKVADTYKVDFDLIDFDALVDDTLTYEENRNNLIDLILGIASSKDFNAKVDIDQKTKKSTVTEEKEKIEKVEMENLKSEEEHAKKEFEESINKVKLGTTKLLEKKFRVTKELIKTLIKSKDINGLILKGGAGIGKSYNTIKTLKDLGMKKGENYEILASYTTPLEFYQFLYENRDKGKVVILDDTMGFFNNKINIGIVLASLWGEGKRIIHYNSSSGKLKVPHSFIFEGKIIWCLNDIPNNLSQEVEAVKSRCFFHELKFSYEEKITLFYEIAKLKNIDTKIIDFIKENTDKLTPNLDFRLVFKIKDIAENNKYWKELAMSLLGKNEKLILMEKFIEECSTIKEAEKKWCEQTGSHRATFYRLRGGK